MQSHYRAFFVQFLRGIDILVKIGNTFIQKSSAGFRSVLQRKGTMSGFIVRGLLTVLGTVVIIVLAYGVARVSQLVLDTSLVPEGTIFQVVIVVALASVMIVLVGSVLKLLTVSNKWYDKRIFMRYQQARKKWAQAPRQDGLPVRPWCTDADGRPVSPVGRDVDEGLL